MTTHGGKRPGAGRKKGAVNKKTLEAMAVKREYLDRIRQNADKLFNAQFSLAVGTQMLFKIHTNKDGKRGKPELVTDEATIIAFLDENEGADGTINGDPSDYYFITTKVPDSRTITDMLDRAIGKPEINIDHTSGGEKIQPVTVVDLGALNADKHEAEPDSASDKQPTE